MSRLFSILCILSISLADSKTVAISYFDNTSGTEEYNPLSKGLADMLITDLSNVKSLKIVEREKLESLLKEIDLGDSKFIDPNTAQKLGKGLGAGYMLTGSFLIMGETMRIDARLIDVGTGEISMAEEITGEKNTFFELEKNLVNKLITTLNLELSKIEVRKVKKVQTESFESFSAYSSSLVSFDLGNYELSQKLLEEAIEIDDGNDVAWEKLEKIQILVDNLIKSRKYNLPEKTIKIIDEVDITKNENLNSQMVGMMFEHRKDFYEMLTDFVFSEQGDSTLMVESFSGTYPGSRDTNFNILVKKLENYLNVKLYLDSKEFNKDLGGMQMNPWLSSWGYTAWYMEMWIPALYLLEDVYGQEKFIINLADEDGVAASEAVNNLIISHCLNMLKYYPYYHDEITGDYLNQAMERKKSQNIKKAILWLSNFHPMMNPLTTNHSFFYNKEKLITFHGDLIHRRNNIFPDSVILEGLDSLIDNIEVNMEYPKRLDILKIIDDKTSINIKMYEDVGKTMGFSEFLEKVKTINPPVYDENGIRTEYWYSWGSPASSRTEARKKLKEVIIPIEQSVDMVFVEGGTFEMGSNIGDKDEKPVHSVTVSDFNISKTEVTFEHYDVFCDATGRDKPGDDMLSGIDRGPGDPVRWVNWHDVTAFCEWMSKTTGKAYRLPTEAEWEYAARGGNKSKGYEYSGSNDLNAVGWYDNNSGGTPGEFNSGQNINPVAEKQPNELGLYDMSGNVWELCSDWYGEYSSSPQTDPQGSSSGEYRVLRGGSFMYSDSLCRVADRLKGGDFKFMWGGFRLVLSQD